MKVLVANGCSHTAGTNVNPDNLFFCHEVAWPRWVADHFGYKYINLADGGNGSEQISRTTILSVSNMLKQGASSKDLEVVISWSGFDRYEFWSPKAKKHMSVSLGSAMMSHVDPTVKQYVEARSLIEFEDYSNYKNLYHMYVTALFLESKGIKYYFANGVRPFKHPSQFREYRELKNDYISLLGLYGDSRIEKHLGFFDKSVTFKNYLKDIPCTPYGDKQHWGEDGQKKYADLIIKHIENLGV